MQMVNHGLVVAPLFFIVGILAARAGGSDSLEKMGGIAFRAPVLAALFLIVTLATLAMPGSPNFVGELLILFGTFENELVYGLVAGTGVVLAAVYMIRFYQRSMHNRVGENVASRDLGRIELVAIAPIVAAIVGLGVYPQLVLDRSDEATRASVRPAIAASEGGTAAAATPPTLPQPTTPTPGAPQQVQPGTPQQVQPGAPPQVQPQAPQEVPTQP
jgi:NADH-quinone oxidoreductase subunit M